MAASGPKVDLKQQLQRLKAQLPVKDDDQSDNQKFLSSLKNYNQTIRNEYKSDNEFAENIVKNKLRYHNYILIESYLIIDSLLPFLSTADQSLLSNKISRFLSDPTSVTDLYVNVGIIDRELSPKLPALSILNQIKQQRVELSLPLLDAAIRSHDFISVPFTLAFPSHILGHTILSISPKYTTAAELSNWADEQILSMQQKTLEAAKKALVAATQAETTARKALQAAVKSNDQLIIVALHNATLEKLKAWEQVLNLREAINTKKPDSAEQKDIAAQKERLADNRAKAQITAAKLAAKSPATDVKKAAPSKKAATTPAAKPAAATAGAAAKTSPLSLHSAVVGHAARPANAAAATPTATAAPAAAAAKK